MYLMRKMNRIGMMATAGVGAAALAAGIALPANAQERDWSDESSTTTVTSSFDAFRAWVQDNVLGSGNDLTAGNLGIDGGLVDGPLISDVGNGAVLSGNHAPVLSGNEVTAPVASGNDTSVEAPVGSGNKVGNGNSTGNGNVVGSGNDTGVSLGDIGADVDDLVGDITGDVDDLVDVDSMLQGIFD
jgi:hypothetical protein